MFARELRLAKNIYDIMAICYVHINENTDFKNPSKNSCFYLDTILLDTILKKYIENKNLDPFLAFYNLKQELYLLQEQYPFSAYDFYKLLIRIDSYEIYNYNCSALFDDSFKNYSGLNYLYTDTVKIYPVMLCSYREHLNSIYENEYKRDYLRARKSYDTLSINYELKNYILYENPNYNIFIHELIDYEDFMYDIKYNDNIKIAICPITSINLHNIFEMEYTSDYKFNIKSMYSTIEESILKKCKEFIETLNDNIEFLIFPEMLMTDSIIETVKILAIKKNIKFIICGSLWRNKQNVCRVFYYGEEIFDYYKKIPFEIKYSKYDLLNVINRCKDENQKLLLSKILVSYDFTNELRFKENLEKESSIHIIDINNFGRILIFICRDIDDDNYMNISKIFLSDFIFLPACTPSGDLLSNPVTLSERYHCTTIMCNTCSALCKSENHLNSKIENKSNIGFIVTPSKDDTTRSHTKHFYTFNDGCKNCNTRCNGRIFTIDMVDLQKTDTSVSLNINEIGR